MPETVNELRISVDELAADARRLRSVLNRTMFVGVGIILVTLIAVAAAVSVQVSNGAAIEQNNQRWCPTLSLLILHPGDPRPTSPRALRIAQQTQILYDAYGCTDDGADFATTTPSPS